MSSAPATATKAPAKAPVKKSTEPSAKETPAKPTSFTCPKVSAVVQHKNDFLQMDSLHTNRGMQLPDTTRAKPNCSINVNHTNEMCSNRTLGHQLILSAKYERMEKSSC